MSYTDTTLAKSVCPFDVRVCGAQKSRKDLTGDETTPVKITVTDLPAGEVCLYKVYAKCDGPTVKIDGEASSDLKIERVDMEDKDEKNATLAKTGTGKRVLAYATSDKGTNKPNSKAAKEADGTTTNKPRNTNVTSAKSTDTFSKDDVTKQVCTMEQA
jgi:hypothetical protein